MTAEQRERVRAIRRQAYRLARVVDHTRAVLARQIIDLCDELLVIEPEPRALQPNAEGNT